jgi:hypothetical protein
MRLGPLENHSRHFAVTLEMVIDHAIRQPHAASMTGIPAKATAATLDVGGWRARARRLPQSAAAYPVALPQTKNHPPENHPPAAP